MNVKLGEMPASQQLAAAEQQPQEPESGDTLEGFGLTVTPAEDGNGLVVTDVSPDGEAAARGIQAGDVIVSVNSKQIKAVGDVDEAVKAATGAGRKAVLFQVQRDAANRFVALPVDQG